jgi:tRNA G18 (ribose-2'-O)-methylase SpoU
VEGSEGMKNRLKTEIIDDVNADAIVIYNQFRENAFRADNSFVADSPKVVNLLLESDIEIKSVLATQEYYDEHQGLLIHKSIEHLFVATKELMRSIVGHKIHHNVMMHGIRPSEVTLQDLDDTIIMLDEISSTQNIGSIARSAAAIGINSYVVPTHGPHPYSRRALRVSMGYVSKLKLHVYSDILETIKVLKNMGYTIFAAEVTSGSIALCKVRVPKKWVLIMGHEGEGLSDEILDACDILVEIEMMEGIKSFNVGVAASIMMYQFKTSYNM